jgi:hypothetical protein
VLAREAGDDLDGLLDMPPAQSSAAIRVAAST